MSVATPWHIFIYRLPTNPSRSRVAVWRELRRLGALPLQQSVVAVPAVADFVDRLDAIEARILDESGTVYRFALTDPAPELHDRLVQEWNQVRDQEYGEIIEECETRFRSEVEFELFRGNLTGSEAEEIEADLEKIRTWFDRVTARDQFAASRRDQAAVAIEQAQTLLDDFVDRVFDAEAAQGGLALDLPEVPRLHPVTQLPTAPEDAPKDAKRARGRS